MEEHEQVIMLRKFPQLFAIDYACTLYQGYIRAGEQDWELCVSAPHYPRLADVTLTYSWQLGQILEQSTAEMNDCKTKCSTLLEYLCAFQHLVEMRLRSTEVTERFPPARRPPTHAYQTTCAEMERVGVGNVDSLSADLKEVCVSSVDYAGRKHVLCLQRRGLAGEYALAAQLPAKVMLQSVAGRTISQYYSLFVELVRKMEDFLDTMEELDRHCWVVDPEVPDRTHTHRRINIADGVSVLVSVDPLRPRARPDLKVLGSVSGAAPFLAALNTALLDQAWSCEVNVVSNLLNELELPCFPTQPAPTADRHLQLVQAGECHVCYEERGEGGQLAEVRCEVGLCGRAYHPYCLYRWLTMGGQGKTLYSRVHGPCPNCNKPISCPVPQLC